jgi:hypothetical protein
MSPAIENPKAAISDALDQAEKRGSLDIAKAIAANTYSKRIVISDTETRH